MEKSNPNAPNSTNNTITTPDFSSLMDDDISTTGDWMNVNKEKSRDKPGIKVEVGGNSVAKAPVMEGSGKGKGRAVGSGARCVTMAGTPSTAVTGAPPCTTCSATSPH